MQIKIEKLGVRGDGIAKYEGKTVYVEGVLAGEVVEVESVAPRAGGIAAKLLKVIEPSPLRQVPPCPNFDHCGGCALQHMQKNAYQQWKLDLLNNGLANAGLNITATPLFWAAANSRRRANLRMVKQNGATAVGFYERFSNTVVDIEQCPILMPELLKTAQLLRENGKKVLKMAGACEVTLTVVDQGIDAAFKFSKKANIAEHLLILATASNLCSASFSMDDDNWQQITPQQATVNFANVAVTLPPAAFLQATTESEQVMQQQVLSTFANCTKVADLFAGCGTFAVPLAAAGKTVVAAENDVDSIRALSATNLVETQVRDLFKNPLSALELIDFDGIVLDPPRAGAAAQVAQIAQSAVLKVVMISCNVETFARDAKTLTDGGYKLENTQLVDQFLWSTHVEVVGIFTR